MIESTRRLLVSLLFCIGATLCWGFACFFVNWRVYLEDTGGVQNNESVAASLIYAGIGSILANAIFLITWPQRPFQWIKPLPVFWSIMTGLLYSFGTYQYIISAEMNIPATIAGPICGLHVLVPPMWYIMFYKKCLGAKTAAGFLLSSVSVVLFSGLLSESVSYSLSMEDSGTLTLIFFIWGCGMITQAEAGKGCTFKQFPQVNTFMTIGYVAGYFIYACSMDSSEITKRSTWLSWGVDKTLALLPTVCMSLGSGFFSVCLMYTDNANLMVAITSFNITVPAILGIVILEEPATWNVLLGLLFALLGIIVLSFDVKGETNCPKVSRIRTIGSIASVHENGYRIQTVSSKPLLSESS